jgi:hypothetical protein
MKVIVVLLCLGIVTSCSTTQEKRSLSQRIQAEEVRSLKEIESHAGFLLESHSELDQNTKNELRFLISSTMAKQQALKDEESKIFQLLLSKSFRVNDLTEKELKDKDSLKLRLKEVYEEKSKNILILINKIVSLSEQKVINESFRNDMMDFMRDFR